MANNDLIFNAAIQGATGGAAQRWLTKQAEADYDDLSAQIVVFATAVDAEIAADPTITQGDADLMALICNGVMAERWPAAFTSLNLVNVALAVKAMWGRLKSETTPIAPDLALLSHVYYADADATANGNGNIESPFDNLADAIAAVQADPLPFFCVILAVGSFTEDVTIDVAGTLRISSVAPNVTFEINGDVTVDGAGINVFLNGGSCGDLTITGVPSVTLTNFNVSGTITSDGGITGDKLIVGSSASTASGSFTDSSFGSSLDITDAAASNTWKNVSVVGNVSAQELVAEDCDFTFDFETAGNTTLRNCTVGNNTILGNNSVVKDCEFSGTVTVSTGDLEIENCSVVGTLTLDGVLNSVNNNLAAIALTGVESHTMELTQYSALSAPASATVTSDSWSASWAEITGGATRSIRAPRATLTVNVPALAANAIGTVAVALTGTVLAGLTVNQQVVANEPTAGVTGGGFLAGVRVTSTNNVTFTFHGPTAGGNQNFIVTQI